MIRVGYVSGPDPDALLDPGHALWRPAPSSLLELMGTPLGLQPTAAVRASWADKKIGSIDRVRVAAVHDGRILAFRLEWQDAHEDRELDDTTAFADAAAILLPSKPGASAVTMGAPGTPVNAWYWRADAHDQGRHLVAEGLGTTRTVDLEMVRARGVWKEGRWRVVLARPLAVRTSEPVAQLAPGDETGFAVAIWEGSHRERAGLKAFSGDWQPLRLAPLPSARS